MFVYIHGRCSRDRVVERRCSVHFIGRNDEGVGESVRIDKRLFRFESAAKVRVDRDLNDVFLLGFFEQADDAHAGNGKHIGYLFLRLFSDIIIPCTSHDKLFFPVGRHFRPFSPDPNKISFYEHNITTFKKTQQKNMHIGNKFQPILPVFCQHIGLAVSNI